MKSSLFIFDKINVCEFIKRFVVFKLHKTSLLLIALFFFQSPHYITKLCPLSSFCSSLKLILFENFFSLPTDFKLRVLTCFLFKEKTFYLSTSQFFLLCSKHHFLYARSCSIKELEASIILMCYKNHPSI